MTSDTRPVVFCTATNRVIDLLRRGETPETAIQRLAEYGTALTVLPLDEAADRYEATFKSGPVEITEARFMEMLEVLPPHDWRNTGDAESFKLIERTAGSITGIYARVGRRYFHLSDSITTPHADIIARIRDSDASRSPLPDRPETR